MQTSAPLIPNTTVPDQLVAVSPNKKFKNVSLIVLAVCVSSFIFGLGGYYLGRQNSVDQMTASVQTTTTPQPTPAASPTLVTTQPGWETYSTAEYTFQHPAGLRSDTGAAGIEYESIRFSLMGPKQIASGRTQTELFDGYVFIVTNLGSAQEKAADQWAGERRANELENCLDGEISELKKVTAVNAVGLQYLAKGCYIDYTATYFTNGTNVYEVTQAYTGEPADQAAYQAITEQIFATLEFL